MSVPPAPPTLSYEPQRNDKHARRARILARNHPGLVITTVLFYVLAFPCCVRGAEEVTLISTVMCWAGQLYFAVRLSAPFWTPAAGRMRILEDVGLCVGTLFPFIGLAATVSVLRHARGYLRLAGYRPGLVFVARPSNH